jgi:hypothetical protein
MKKGSDPSEKKAVLMIWIGTGAFLIGVFGYHIKFLAAG